MSRSEKSETRAYLIQDSIFGTLINPTSPTHVLTPTPTTQEGTQKYLSSLDGGRKRVEDFSIVVRSIVTHAQALYTRSRTQVHEKESRILASWWTIRTHARVCSHTHAHTLAQVENPDEDAVNPDEYEEFFSQFGQVAYVTVAKNNSNVVCRDQGFFPQGNTNLSRGNSRRKENRKCG